MLLNKKNRILNFLLTPADTGHVPFDHKDIHFIINKQNITIKDIEEHFFKNIKKYTNFDLCSFAIDNQNVKVFSYLLKDKSKNPFKRTIDTLLKKDFGIHQFDNRYLINAVFSQRQFNPAFFDLLMEYNLLSIKSDEILLYYFSKVNNLKLIKMININKVVKNGKIEDKVVFNAIVSNNLETLDYIIDIYFKYNKDIDVLKNYFEFLIRINTQETFDCIINIMLKNNTYSIKDLLEIMVKEIIITKIKSNTFIGFLINNPLIKEELSKIENIDILNHLIKGSNIENVELIYAEFDILKKFPLPSSLLFSAINKQNLNLVKLFFNQPIDFIAISLNNNKYLNIHNFLLEACTNSESYKTNLDIIKLILQNKQYFNNADINTIEYNTYFEIICDTCDTKLIKNSLDYFRTFKDCIIDIDTILSDVGICLNLETYSLLRKEFPLYEEKNEEQTKLYNIYLKMKIKPHFEVLNDEDYEFVLNNLNCSLDIVNFLTKNHFQPLMVKYGLHNLENYIYHDFRFENISDLKNFNLQDLIYKFSNIKKDLNILFNSEYYADKEYIEMDYVFKNMILNPNYDNIKPILKRIEEWRLFTPNENIIYFLHEYNINLIDLDIKNDIKPLLKWIDNNFLTLSPDIFNDFKLIVENYDELIEKDIKIDNWINYCNFKNIEIVKTKLPEIIDVFLSSKKDANINISNTQINKYLKMLNERKIITDLFELPSYQLPFYKNIIKDETTGDYLLYEMLPGFDPKSLLVNHALDCCLVDGGASHNILPYMNKNPETCGMFVISKINNIQAYGSLYSLPLINGNQSLHSLPTAEGNWNPLGDILDVLKLKIIEINNICYTLPFNMQDYITINEEIKRILVDRENMESNITILGASFTYLKNNILVFDNIETNNKTFIVDEKGNNVRPQFHL